MGFGDGYSVSAKALVLFGFSGPLDFMKNSDTMTTAGNSAYYGAEIEAGLKSRDFFKPAVFVNYTHGTIQGTLSLGNLLPGRLEGAWQNLIDELPSVRSRTDVHLLSFGGRAYFPFLKGDIGRFHWVAIAPEFGAGVFYANSHTRSQQQISDDELRVFTSDSHEFGVLVQLGMRLFELGGGPVTFNVDVIGDIGAGSMFIAFGGVSAGLTYYFGQ